MPAEAVAVRRNSFVTALTKVNRTAKSNNYRDLGMVSRVKPSLFHTFFAISASNRARKAASASAGGRGFSLTVSHP